MDIKNSVLVEQDRDEMSRYAPIPLNSYDPNPYP